MMRNIALFIPLALLGCSETALVSPPDTDGPTRVDAAVAIFVDGEQVDVVDFGTVLVGDASSVDVEVRSVGTDTLQVRDLTVFVPEVTVDADAAQTLLAPGASAEVTLTWRPGADGLLQSRFEVRTNDRATPTSLLELRGDGLGPALTMTPPTYDFGDLEFGCTNILTVELANTGRGVLTIDAIDLDDFSAEGEVVLQHAHVLPMTLGPGEVRTVDLAYSPMDSVADTSELRVSSNDPTAPEAGRSVRQFGTGHPGEAASDNFEQGGVGLTDVLFVVDNSCSMYDEQTTFAANFPLFVPILEDADTDYQLAATTTDAGDNGMFVGSVPIVTPSTPDPAATFAANVQLGTTGAGYEQAMLGAWLALDPSNGMNPGFLRDTAELHIILISDAVDFSTDAGMPFQTPDGYVNAYRSVKDDPDMVTVHDISGQASGCTGPGGSAQGSTNLITASGLTGGISASICAADWVVALEALAFEASATANTFPLTQPAVENSIEVYMNGAFVTQGWVYDTVANAVVFNGAYIPDEGDQIVVNYWVAGGCND